MSEHTHEHSHTHTHEHTHDHSHAHTHEHDHDHSHARSHSHNHSHGTEELSREEQLAMLAYMHHHNVHHAEELHDLAHNVGGEAAKLIHEAVADFASGNDKLAKALALLQEEN